MSYIDQQPIFLGQLRKKKPFALILRKDWKFRSLKDNNQRKYSGKLFPCVSKQYAKFNINCVIISFQLYN